MNGVGPAISIPLISLDKAIPTAAAMLPLFIEFATYY